MTDEMVASLRAQLGDAALVELAAVIAFANLLRPFNRLAPGAEILPMLVNGAVGGRIVGTDDGYDTAISFVVEADRITRIYAVRNPAKLGRIDVESTISR